MIDAFDAIDISTIDMIAYNKLGPYKLAVPTFPIITDHHQLNFGLPMTMENQ